MITTKEKEDLLVDLQNKFNVVLQGDDPSLVAWYLQSQILEDFKASLIGLEERRQQDIQVIKEITDNFSQNMDAAIQDVTKTILDLSSIKLLEDTEKTRQDANKAVLTGVNKALEKISNRFNSETAKLEQAVKVQTNRVEKGTDQKMKNTLFFLGGLGFGAIITIMVAALVFLIKH